MACNYWSFTASQIDINNATGNTSPNINNVVYFGWRDCNGAEQSIYAATAGTYDNLVEGECVDNSFTTPEVYYYLNNVKTSAVNSSYSILDDCNGVKILFCDTSNSIFIYNVTPPLIEDTIYFIEDLSGYLRCGTVVINDGIYDYSVDGSGWVFNEIFSCNDTACQVFCNYADASVDSTDLSDATGNTDVSKNNKLFFDFIDCNGNPQEISFSTAGYFTNAVCIGRSSTSSFYYKNNVRTQGNNSYLQDTYTICTPSETPTPTPTLTNTPTNTGTPTPTPTSTPTPTNTETPTNTPTNTGTLTNTPTNTPTPTNTETPTNTPTPTITPPHIPVDYMFVGLMAYNEGEYVNGALNTNRISVAVNNSVNYGDLIWCATCAVCNNYSLMVDSLFMNKLEISPTKPLCYKTDDLTDESLIYLITMIAAVKSQGPFTTLSDAMDWVRLNGIFITNQNYPPIITIGNTLHLDAGLPASYPMVGTSWYDLTGNNNNGILNNGISYNPLLKGYLEFNGVNQYVSFSGTTNIPVGNSNYTIGVWFNANSLGDKGLVGWGNYGSTNEVNAFRLTTTGLVNYWWGNDFSVNVTITPGNWYYTVTTFDGTTRSIYVNGSLVGSDTPTGHNVTTSSNLTIGRIWTGEYFDGSIGDVQIFGRALSPTEINTNYNSLLTRYLNDNTEICLTPVYCESPTPTPTPTTTPTLSYNFDADSSDWTAVGVTDQSSFNSTFNVTTDNFILNGNNIKANITGDNFFFYVFNGGNKNITNFNYLTSNTLFNVLSLNDNNIVDFNPTIALPNIIQSINLNNNQIEDFNPSIPLPPIDLLNLDNNQIVTLNPTIPLPTTILQLYLSNNLMTLSSYTTLETWANSLPIGGGSAHFSGNIDSVSGTNLETILISKGWYVYS